MTGSHQDAASFSTSRGGMQHPTLGGGYAGNMPGVEGDLVYYPDSRVHPNNGNRYRHPGSTGTFSDVCPISSERRNVHGSHMFSSSQQQSQPMPYGREVCRQLDAVL